MLAKIWHFLIGSPLPTQAAGQKRLSNIRALAAFSPDALSSIAYANQEIFLSLVLAGSAGLSLAWGIGLSITTLLAIVALSYFQTIHAYPSGGGSYVVARENLGNLPGLIAAAALTVDYLLTAAVSLTAGVAAIASAFPALWPHQVTLALVLLAIITMANLRGMHEMSTTIGIPVYLFLGTYLPMLGYGVIRLFIDGFGSLEAVAPPAIEPVTLVIVLHTFAAGCTALTGIEAISNGVPAFHPPETRNASRTLLAMAILMGLLFIGSIGLTQFLAVIPGEQETILSALARRILGSGPAYMIIQINTLLILAVAANTSFSGFPRLAAILAQDGFLPRQLTHLGERLVFSNGITLLTAGTAFLIIVFRGDTHALIPLFAVGVFLAFTLSQTGMVVHWWREKGKGWEWKTIINATGAITTLIALVIIGYSKFTRGAWIILVLVPIFVVVFARIREHYNEVAAELSMRGLPPSLRPAPAPRVVIPVSGVHRAMVGALNYARSISKDITALYVEFEPGKGEEMRKRWAKWWPDIPLVVVPSPYRSIVGPLLEFLDRIDKERNDGQLATVILPEFVPARWWHSFLHNQTAWLLKFALLYHRRLHNLERVIIEVPFHLRR
ncbi:MAG TPA: APC family permease [Anaerolineales bacterium]|nr:APC family permease [Anaerolineales bacterium]